MKQRERLSLNDVAKLLDIAPSTIRGYLSRGQMPKPSACPCCGSSTWDRQEVKTWAKLRPGRTGRPRKAGQS